MHGNMTFGIKSSFGAADQSVIQATRRALPRPPGTPGLNWTGPNFHTLLGFKKRSRMTRIWEFPFTKFIIVNRNCCKVDNWSVVMMSSRQSSDIQQSQGPHLQRLAKQERNIRQVEEPDNLSGPEAEGCFDLGLWGGPDSVSPSRVCEDRPHCMICGSYYH